VKRYYSVGHREPCGHHHRTRAGAERCARAFLRANLRDLSIEAREHGMTMPEYINRIISETTGDCLICRITLAGGAK